MGGILVLFLTSCGSLLTSRDQTSHQVIPAYTDPDEEQSEVQNNDQGEVIQMNERQSTVSNPVLKKESPELPAQPTHAKSKAQGDVSEMPFPLIVQSLIERAEKAIKMQQWLRAQHTLEQAIHISPNNAKVFLIYGDVYLNLGILEQAEQMYRRSMALADEYSPVGRLAKNKLEALKTGN